MKVCRCAYHIGAAACKPHRQRKARICAQVYQRQLSKEGLQALVNNAAGGGAVGSAAEDEAPAVAAGGPNIQSAEDLRDLFTLRSSTLSDVRPEQSTATFFSAILCTAPPSTPHAGSA